jgi:NADH:ubiquinone oxidoreductase subunit 6 (subunit J)
MAGYLISSTAFAVAFLLGATGLGRPRVVLFVGGVLALGWLAALAAKEAEDARTHEAPPLWLLAGLVGLLYVIWCGGLWLGLRLRRARSS